MSIDYSDLPYAHQETKKWYTWVTVVLGVGLCIVFVPEIVNGKNLFGGDSTMLLGLLVIGGFASLFVQYIDAKRQEAQFQAFVTKNGLQEVSKANIFEILPSAINFTDKAQVVSQAVTIPGTTINLFTYSFFTRQGRQQVMHTYTVIIQSLGESLPHLYLDAVGNGLSHRYSEAQHIALEGNFNDYFKLYSPEVANIEALQLITPDVMETMIALGASYDVEIEQNRLAVFAPGELLARDTLPVMMQFCTALHAKLSNNPVNWQPVIDEQNERQVTRSKLRPGSYVWRGLIATAVTAVLYIAYIAILR